MYTIDNAPAENIHTFNGVSRLRVDETKTPYRHSAEAFGFYDDKGREFGARVAVYEIDATLADMSEPRSTYCINKRTGRFYCAQPHATRDGKDYGAYPNGGCFDTAEQRDAYVVKYFAEARKRAAKNKNRAA